MSEYLNNQSHRREILKGLIRDLHAGKSVEQVKDRFAAAIAGVTPAEISALEQHAEALVHGEGNRQSLADDLARLGQLDRHYVRKERTTRIYRKIKKAPVWEVQPHPAPPLSPREGERAG